MRIFGTIFATEKYDHLIKGYMKYLAFDIEAANGYKPYSICSIGIVTADEQFNILSRKNVWINPKTSYNLNGTRPNVGIDLHLDKALLERSPDFSQAYAEISGLLSSPEYVVVGHAVDSDVRMLNAACKRYKLPCIEFPFICSQLLYKLYKGDKEVHGLDKIALEMGVEFQQHNSEEDAYVSLLTLKYLTEQSGLGVDGLLEKYRVRKGKNENFEITRSASLLGQVSKKQLTQKAIAKIKDYAKTVKRTSFKYRDKAFCLARSLELSDSDVLYDVVKVIISNGGRYVSKLAKCSVYVYGNEPTDTDVMREKRVIDLESSGLLKTATVKQILEGEV